jgi:predicted small secreted protein
MKSLKNLIALLMIAGFTIAIGGCNTIGGFGQDVEEGGEAISDTAEDVEEDM